MNSRQRKIVQSITPNILTGFEPVDLLPYLQVKLLISDEDVNRIQNKTDQRFRVADFLVVVQQKIDNLDILTEALDQCGYLHISKLIREAEEANPEIPQSPVNTTELKGKDGGGQAEPSEQKMEDRPSSKEGDKQGPIAAPRKTKAKPSGRVSAMKKFFEAKTQGSPLDADMHFLIQNTNFSEKQIRQWFKEFIEVCPEGKINKTQFALFYAKVDPDTELTEEFCDHVFRCFDLDRSGFIDFKEFLMALNIKRSGDPETKLKWVFRLYDINGDGTIDLPEMTRIIESIFSMLGTGVEDDDVATEFDARACAAALFRNIDTNCDGELTEEEFVAACQKDQFLYSILTSASLM